MRLITFLFAFCCWQSAFLQGAENSQFENDYDWIEAQDLDADSGQQETDLTKSDETADNDAEAASAGDSQISAYVGDSVSEKSSLSSYNLKIGLAAVDYAQLSYHDLLYGKESNIAMIRYDEFFYKGLVSLGLTFGAGYYRKNGKPSKTDDPKSAGDLVAREQYGLEMLNIPLQFSGLIAVPIYGDWIDLNLWFGLQALYVQERRFSEQADSDSDSAGPLVNAGFNNEAVYGAAINLNIDWLETGSRWGLNSMGLKSVCLSPFFESVVSQSGKMGPFDRTLLGAMFTFKSSK